MPPVRSSRSVRYTSEQLERARAAEKSDDEWLEELCRPSASSSRSIGPLPCQPTTPRLESAPTTIAVPSVPPNSPLPCPNGEVEISVPRLQDGSHRRCDRTSGSMGDLVSVYLVGLSEKRWAVVPSLFSMHFPPNGAPIHGPEWEHMLNRATSIVCATIFDDGVPRIFKIGITTNPQHRFCNFCYGYHTEGYEQMVLLAATLPSWAARLEQCLISTFGSKQGCRNVAGGGESTPSVGPVFVYLVWVSSGNLTEFRLRRKRCHADV